jgi:putative endonuclease
MALSKGLRPASKGTSVIYILRLRSGAFYVGASEDLECRLEDHGSGRASRTTRLDSPVSLLHLEFCASFAAARRREAQLKRWSRAKKEALIGGDLAALKRLSRSREPRPG